MKAGSGQGPGSCSELALYVMKNAPSQPEALAKPLPVPDYAFQMISSDYLIYARK